MSTQASSTSLYNGFFNSPHPIQEERSSFFRASENEEDAAASKSLYSTTITKPVSSSSSQSPSSLNKPASFLLSDVVTRGSSSLNQTFREAIQ